MDEPLYLCVFLNVFLVKEANINEFVQSAFVGSGFLHVFYLLPAAYLWFSCDFDFSSFCGWSRETGSGAEWFMQTREAPAIHRGPTLDHKGRTSGTQQMLWEST